MRSLISYLIFIFAVIFWIFRVVLTLLLNFGIDFGVITMGPTYEIVLAFATLFLLIFVYKRNLIGGAIYSCVYLFYFGTSLFNSLNSIKINLANIFLSSFGLLLAIAVLIDVITKQERELKNKGDKKTDWYYNNKKFDRQLDERADKNNYKTL